MGKKSYGVYFSILMVALVLVCAFIYNNRLNKELDTSKENRENDKINSNDIDSILENMTIEEKIGQMLIIDFINTDMTDKLRDYYNSIKPGGIILMGDNYSTFDRTKKLVSDVKSLSSVPLIVSTDQEGGLVQRLQKLEDESPTYIPDMLSVGNTGDTLIAYNIGKVMALEMRTLGINVVNAPVVDVFSNPNNKVIGNRSFGSNPQVVSKMSVSLAKGLEDNGVIPTYKHFPGHGDTDVDSHESLPVINKSLEGLANLELIPFRNAIDNGAKIIMTAHIALPLITGDMTPASLSKKLLTDVLRRDLGYDGIIITDALNMDALTDNYSDEEIYLKAVEAGVDILLMPKDAELAINVIKENVSEDRINESVKRILEFKYKYLNDYEYTDKSILGCAEHQNIINKVNFER